MTAIRIFLADDHPILRVALRNLLEAAGFEVVGEAGNGRDALAGIRALRPDVAVLDVEMEEMNGVDVARALHEDPELSSGVRVLVLSAYDDEGYVRDLLDCGVDGYLLKDEVEDVIVEAVREVARGRTGHLSRGVAARLMALRQQPPSARANLLSRREREVLEQVARGASNKEVAARLKISSHTVKNHLTNIYTKIGVDSRFAAMTWARRQGLVSL